MAIYIKRSPALDGQRLTRLRSAKRGTQAYRAKRYNDLFARNRDRGTAPTIVIDRCQRNAEFRSEIREVQVSGAASRSTRHARRRAGSATGPLAADESAALLEADRADVDRHHQHFRNRPAVWTARVGTALGGQANPVRRHIV